MVKNRETSGDRAFSYVTSSFCASSACWYLSALLHADRLRQRRAGRYPREISVFPKGINLEAYKYIVTDKYVPQSYLNTIKYTFVGTLINVGMTALCAYPLSRKKLPGAAFSP
jgi:putative aldouronate transport system permease protein